MAVPSAFLNCGTTFGDLDSRHHVRHGDTITVRCPSECISAQGNVRGHPGMYGQASSICRSAIHVSNFHTLFPTICNVTHARMRACMHVQAGVVADSGGIVEVQPTGSAGGVRQFEQNSANGITAQSTSAGGGTSTFSENYFILMPPNGIFCSYPVIRGLAHIHAEDASEAFAVSSFLDISNAPLEAATNSTSAAAGQQQGNNSTGPNPSFGRSSTAPTAAVNTTAALQRFLMTTVKGQSQGKPDAIAACMLSVAPPFPSFVFLGPSSPVRRLICGEPAVEEPPASE
eukprot:GHVU01061079.1.p1 GENE.GHVU01061079.1~~GHVU01061079.1.p1  ORF type:complete len:287 (-),score=21.77 GHVU01061079.1:918-1778(-)